MAETLEKPETIEYTPEELEQIRELTQFYRLAPGQIAPAADLAQDLSDGPEDNTPLNIEDHSGFTDEPASADDIEPVSDFGGSIPADTGKAAPVRSDLTDLDDLLNADLDNLDALDLKGKDAQEKPADITAPATGDFTDETGFTPEPISTGSDTDFSLDDFNLPAQTDINQPEEITDFGLEEPKQADTGVPAGDFDMGFPDTETTQQDVLPQQTEFSDTPETLDFNTDFGGTDFTTPADDGLTVPDAGGFDLPDQPANAGDQADFGDFGSIDTPPSDLGGGLDFDLPADDTFSEPQPADTSPVSSDGFDSFDLPSDSPDALSFNDTPDISSAPSGDLPPDFGVADSMDFGSADMSFSDTPTHDIPGAPSLDDLSPEIAVHHGSIDSDLSSLASEHTGPQIDPEEMRRLRARLKEYPADVRRLVSSSLLDDKFSDQLAADFVQMVLAGAGPDEVRDFLGRKVGAVSAPADDSPGAARVIVTRPEYTEEGLARQAQLIRLTRIGSLAAVVLIGLIGGLYFSILKPLLYKREIAKGREVILAKGSAPGATEQAEKHFQNAVKYYPDDSQAYLQFADAYRRQGMYDDSFKKLFADTELENTGKAIRFEEKEISDANGFWSSLKKVPVVTYAGNDKNKLKINGLTFTLRKPGAYVLTHLQNNSPSAAVLAALGEFHANPARRFRKSPYANSALGLDYYKRILTFKTDMPMFKGEAMVERAILGIGNIYYNQKDFNRALDYFEKVTSKDPLNVAAHSGALRALIRIARNTGDPRLVLQQHSLIKHKLKIEDKLPLYMKARLAAFYIDLPAENDIRILYNISPVDSVTGKQIKSRARELLDSLFVSKEEDAFGNTVEGKDFAEGYYQRGRYFGKDEKQTRMALKQFEYAFNFDKRHFLALNDRAELLIDLKDYAGAIDLLKLALPEIEPEKMDMLGDNEADETLSEADTGMIPFNMGKAMYLGVVRDLADSESWLRIDEVRKFNNGSERGIEGLSAQLDRIESFFQQAREKGLKDKKARNSLSYYEGWTSFVRGNYRQALSNWSEIPAEDMFSFTGLELAKSHCYYKLAADNAAEKQKHLETALGLLQYSRGKFQKPADKIKEPSPGNKQHIQIFSRLAIVENNMGAVYELMGDEKNSLQHYWRSVDYGKKAGRENEVAQVNIRLNFKRAGLEDEEAVPLIMDYISPYTGQ
jgi:tetratricopeptide (TPR) repeat protein